MHKEKPESHRSRMPPQAKNKSIKFHAKTDIRVRIGGRMMHWQPGEGIDLDEETVRQYLHVNDYETIKTKTKNSESRIKNKEEKKIDSGKILNSDFVSWPSPTQSKQP